MIKEYNNIVKNKHKTKEVLLQAIKEVVNDNDYQDKLNDLNNQKLTIEQRLSKIIDIELDNTDIDRKELFIKKEKELINELSDIKNKIRYYEDLLAENKGLSKQLKSIDDYFNEPSELKQFKRDVFEKMIECIIEGEYDENGNKLPRVARFVLNTGKEYKFTIPPKNNSKKDKDELVPFYTGNASCFNGSR